MEHRHYANLLVNMYDLTDSDPAQIAALLSQDHVNAIDAAVADLLKVKANGVRMHRAVVRFYGICDFYKVTLRHIGSEFDPSVTDKRVGEIRRKAEHLLRENNKLQPVAQRLHEHGFTNKRIERTRQLLTPEQQQQLTQIALISDRRKKIAALQAFNVQSLGFSIPTANSLKNIGIDTVAELCNCSKAELLSKPNFGRRALNEVETVLWDRLNERLKAR